MPIASNATANMSRRQSFNGKGLTFIEMIFDVDMLTTATTPDTKDSVFQTCRDIVLEKGTLLASSYRLGLKATERDDAAHMDYLKRDIKYDDKHGGSKKQMLDDEKHISKLAGDLKYDAKKKRKYDNV